MKMMLRLLYTLVLLTIVGSSCREIGLEDPQDGLPVFNATLDFEGLGIQTWEAGIDEYYMFTDYSLDNLDIYTYSGVIEQEGCQPECAQTLSIFIRDLAPNAQGLTSIDEALSQGFYPFASQANNQTNVSYDTSFLYQLDLAIDTAVTNINGEVFAEWMIDGTPIGTSEFSAILQSDILPFEGSTVTLKITDQSQGDSCVSWQTQTIAKALQQRCGVTIEQNFNADSIIESLVAVPQYNSNGPFVYNWNNGTTGIALNSGPFEPLVEYTVQLIDESTDCTSEAGYIWSGNISQPNTSGCSANFVYEMQDMITQIDSTSFPAPVDSFQFSAVTIVYVDAQGNTFRSDLERQNSNTASFSIARVEEFDLNEKGDATKKMELSFRCTLWDANGNALVIKDGEAVWGIAYPN